MEVEKIKQFINYIYGDMVADRVICGKYSVFRPLNVDTKNYHFSRGFSMNDEIIPIFERLWYICVNGTEILNHIVIFDDKIAINGNMEEILNIIESSDDEKLLWVMKNDPQYDRWEHNKAGMLTPLLLGSGFI